MDTLSSNIDRCIKNSLNRYTSFFQEFLRIPTPRMEEHRALRFAGRALKDVGWEVEEFKGQGKGEPTPCGPP